MTIRTALVAGAALALVAGTAAAQAPVTLKMASFVPQASATTRMFNQYVEDVKAKSGGKLALEIFHGASMGPLPRHYDLVRTGVADIAFFQHGATPGRFPLTELTHLPYAFPEGVKGSLVAGQVAMDLVPEFFGKEHEDVHLIWIVYNRPSSVYDGAKPLATLADMRGRRYRSPTTAVTEVMKAFGAVPVGVPATAMAESLQKGTLDGVVTDPIGIFSFRIGNLVKHETPMLTSVISFGLAMNKQAYNARTPEERKIFDSWGGKDGAVRMIKTTWDDFPEFTDYMKSVGIQTGRLTADADREVRKLADDYIARSVAELDAKGQPAKAAWERIKALSARYAATN